MKLTKITSATFFVCVFINILRKQSAKIIGNSYFCFLKYMKTLLYRPR